MGSNLVIGTIGAGIVIAGAAMLAGAWWKARVPSHRFEPDDCPVDTPLGRSLWRQCSMPEIAVGASIAVLPILAFDLYPPRERFLYHRTRTLDRALLACLAEELRDEPWIQERHHVTRQIRRALVLAQIEGGTYPLVDAHSQLDQMEEELREVGVRVQPRAGLSGMQL